MSRDPEENADQPPEVDVHDPDKQAPPADSAAERILEFVTWFGDGEVYPAHEDAPPLYARDLEAAASAVLRVVALHNADGERWVGFPRADRQERYCTHDNKAAPCPTTEALGALWAQS